jgi:hypothetical protein
LIMSFERVIGVGILAVIFVFVAVTLLDRV